MKRLHIHIGVENIADSIKFYSALFDTQPVKIKHGYAKWMLDDPRINFAISTYAKNGVDHLGLQVDDKRELGLIRKRLKKAEMSPFDEGETLCCYAHSEKSWVTDPAGIAWEAYQTLKDIHYFSGIASSAEKASCQSQPKGQPGCCKDPSKAMGRCRL
ncbi:ArsI/CadI family heavy metal resistance metalloenzyme [Microbulbifer sp. 2205BS26-8]|uniref:ArsI/CadI family heavy metal resistance metalloenzyme n=1 Tax=Microbulbifer sp. 2205BS26-8 TaxID=3064386 RepID=UPI00273D4BB5|nr:ArsI/CadI family heavy metal resistance metalloenzyme [Microbulbifer sp. 2205BS26-8]MDP5209380.1 ArsI/CadI family heavy metal resistance metalloenzyme [Microbulbifer sp. 2205BS26-8]